MNESAVYVCCFRERRRGEAASAAAATTWSEARSSCVRPSTCSLPSDASWAAGTRSARVRPMSCMRFSYRWRRRSSLLIFLRAGGAKGGPRSQRVVRLAARTRPSGERDEQRGGSYVRLGHCAFGAQERAAPFVKALSHALGLRALVVALAQLALAEPRIAAVVTGFPAALSLCVVSALQPALPRRLRSPRRRRFLILPLRLAGGCSLPTAAGRFPRRRPPGFGPCLWLRRRRLGAGIACAFA